jgi:DNA-binding transcriptional LysR family regulator
MNESVEGAKIALRSNDKTVQASGPAEGLGICELSCVFGDEQAGLVRVWPDEEPTLRPLWLVIHQDLRRAARIRLLSSALVEAFRRDSKLLRYGHQRGPRK